MNDGFRDFLFTYRHDGAEWGIQIRATSAEDAMARLQSLAWAKYNGEVIATIPIVPRALLHWIGRIASYCTLRR